MIISISGDPGSGKSTIAKMLSEKLGMKRYYMGGILREQAKKRNMTLEDYYALGESDETIDKNLDNYQKKLGETEDNFIIEGRTSFYFIPHSLKIYIAVDEKVGAERIWKELQKKNERNEADNLTSIEDLIKAYKNVLEARRIGIKSIMILMRLI